MLHGMERERKGKERKGKGECHVDALFYFKRGGRGRKGKIREICNCMFVRIMIVCEDGLEKRIGVGGPRHRSLLYYI